MPCSGLNSLTSFTPGRGTARRSSRPPPRVRPVWLVTSPTCLSAQRAELLLDQDVDPASRVGSGRDRSCTGLRRSGSDRPPADGRDGRSGASTIAAAASVATSYRSAVGEAPRPSGCSRLVRMMTNVSVSGSIQRLVPVKPGVAEAGGTEQPAARRALARLDVPAQAPALVRRASRRRRSWSGRPAARARGGRWARLRRSSSVWAKIARSSAVANSPAWPATPPSARDRGSWTTPRSIRPPGVSRLGRGDPLDRDRAAGSRPVDRPEMGVLHAERVRRSAPWRTRRAARPLIRSTSRPRIRNPTSE